MVTLIHLQAEARHPVVQPGFAQYGVGVEHRRQFRNVEERQLQAITEAFFQGPGKHALVERRMERQHRAVAHELEQVEQCLGRVATSRQGARPEAVDQHAGVGFLLRAVQGAFELLGEIDGPVFDGHRADRQHKVAMGVQAAGFQVKHDPALLAQRAHPQRPCLGQPGQALAQGVVHQWGRGAQPGEQAHN